MEERFGADWDYGKGKGEIVAEYAINLRGSSGHAATEKGRKSAVMGKGEVTFRQEREKYAGRSDGAAKEKADNENER